MLIVQNNIGTNNIRRCQLESCTETSNSILILSELLNDIWERCAIASGYAVDRPSLVIP